MTHATLTIPGLDEILQRLDRMEAKVDAALTDRASAWITISQAAAICGKSTATINRWIASGRLECRKIGSDRCIRRGDIPNRQTS